LRIHPPTDWRKPDAAQIKVSGKKINAPIHRLNRDVTAMPLATKRRAGCDVIELTLPAVSVSKVNRWK